jgi:hypothetical protein
MFGELRTGIRNVGHGLLQSVDRLPIPRLWMEALLLVVVETVRITACGASY